jgi:hypothetical protein
MRGESPQGKTVAEPSSFGIRRRARSVVRIRMTDAICTQHFRRHIDGACLMAFAVRDPLGAIAITDGPFTETKEHMI